MIIVCPFDLVQETIDQYQPDRMISILNDEEMSPQVSGIAAENRLKIALSMEEAIDPGSNAKSKNARFRKMINFAREADWSRPLLVHCRLGISRSPAAAFIIQCALDPITSELEHAEKIRAVSATADPSYAMVAEADDYLSRDGRMLDALDKIGSSNGHYSNAAFEIPFTPQS